MLLYTCTTAQETEFYHYNTRWHWTSQWVKSAKSRRHDKIAIRSTKLVSEPERCSAQFCMWQNTRKLARRTDTAFWHLPALLLQALMTRKIRTHGNDCLHHSFEVEGVETLVDNSLESSLLSLLSFPFLFVHNIAAMFIQALASQAYVEFMQIRHSYE